MQTKLLVSLVCTHETERRLRQIRQTYAGQWPFARVLPPFIPLLEISSIPPFDILNKAKTIPWYPMIAQGPLIDSDNILQGPSVVMHLNSKQLNQYRTELKPFFRSIINSEQLPFGDHLILALPSQKQDHCHEINVDNPHILTISTMLLCILQITTDNILETETLTWSVFAEHRVKKGVTSQ